MGCRSCCQKHKLKKGLWSPEEDQKLRRYITKYGLGCWSAVPKQAGLERCGKSCRLRWINYLRPGLKRGRFSVREEIIILESHAVLGNRWSQIASKLPGRTDNEIKNFWNSHVKKKLREMGIDPNTHKPFVLNNNNIVNRSEEKPKETLGSLNGSSVSVDKILFSEWLLPSSPRHEKSAIHDIPDFDCVDIQISELQAPLDTEHRRLNSSTETTFALLPPDNYNNTHVMTLQDLCSDQLVESQWVVSNENKNTWPQILPFIAVQPSTSHVNQILNSELASMSTTTPTCLYTHNKDSIQSDPTASINTTMDNDYMNYWIQYCGGAGSCSSNGRQLQNGALSDSTSF